MSLLLLLSRSQPGPFVTGPGVRARRPQEAPFPPLSPSLLRTDPHGSARGRTSGSWSSVRVLVSGTSPIRRGEQSAFVEPRPAAVAYGFPFFFKIGSQPTPAPRVVPRYDAPPAVASGTFAAQVLGLRAFYHGVVNDLCLVAEADAPSGMGGVVKVQKSGVNYVVYIVETGDANATPIRLQTTLGVKAVRVKTP